MSAPANAAAVTAIILAAQRPGIVNALARDAGVSHKCLVPICGAPLIAHVVDALRNAKGIARIRVSVEPELHALLGARFPGIELVASHTSLTDSVLAAAEGIDGPMLITTADNVLLTTDAIARLRAALGSADVVAGMSAQASVQAISPQAQRRFYMFRDGGYSNCNLYGVAGPYAFAAAEIFREGGQFAKNPRRLVTAFGLLNIVLLFARRLTLAGAMKRISRRFGLTFHALVLEDGALAVDVDNPRTYAIAATVLESRTGYRNAAKAA